MNNQLNVLIKKAQGDRTQNSFALNCGINSATLTRILSGENTPKPEILRKIASHAHNNVTYTDLMVAAGFIDLNEMEDHYYIIPGEPNQIPVAFADALSDLSPDEIDSVYQYIQFIKYKKQKK